MPQKQLKKNKAVRNDSAKPRNESTPEHNPVGTTTSEEINDKNSPAVRDALNESQL